MSDYIYIVYIIQNFIFVANFAGKFRPDIANSSHSTRLTRPACLAYKNVTFAVLDTLRRDRSFVRARPRRWNGRLEPWSSTTEVSLMSNDEDQDRDLTHA